MQIGYGAPLTTRSRLRIAGLALAVVAAPAAAAPGETPAAPASASPAAPTVDALLKRAADDYEGGRCEDVLAAYAAVQQSAPERLDGIARYRWGFCLQRSNPSGAAEQFRKASEMLAAETRSPGAPLDAHFYRVNALLNLELGDQGRAAAEEATARWKSGTLVVPADRPEAWFRLGKLYRDAGDGAGALDPFGRAIALVETKGKPLRDAYIERIARWATEAGDPQLSARAAALLEVSATKTGQDALQLARLDVGLGKLAQARDRFKAARAAGGDVGMLAQYSEAAVNRAIEVQSWKLEPMAALADGTKLHDLASDELQRRLQELVPEITDALTGPSIEVPRRRGKGTKPHPAPEAEKKLQELQARFAGLLVEGVRRGAPLREWAISGGYSNLIHHSFIKLFVQREMQERREPGATTPAGESPRD